MKNDHKINKLLDKLEDRKYQVNNLVMRFVLVLILLILFFVSYEIYSYDYTPFVLSKLQYSYYQNNLNIPPSVNTGHTTEKNNGTGSGTGKNYIQTDVLGKCPSGYCAIDKDTGLKRCPDGDYSVVYNTISEGCTRREYCDIKSLPYAVVSNGATSLSGQCEPGVACRCTNTKTCNTGIATIFLTKFGNGADVNGDASFLIDQQVNTSTEYGYTAIELVNPSSDFCQVNPGFTDRILGGCNFQNSVRDKLDCANISSPVLLSSNPGSSSLASVTHQETKVGSTSFIVERNRDTTPVEIYPIANFKAPGYLQITNSSFGASTSELIRFNKILPYADITIPVFNITERSTDYLTVTDISHVSGVSRGNPEGTFGQKSIAINWPKGSHVNSFEFEERYCTEQTITNANFKNMLLCTQNDRQVCKNGVLSYNFNRLSEENNTTNGILDDQNFSRNFCQQRSNTLPSQTRQDFLEDPGFYTLSCYLGSGCSDKELNLNGKKGLQAAAGKYYPEVDVGGISNTWEATINSYPHFNSNNQSEQIILGEGAIEPGDFWSVKSVSEILTTTEPSASGTGVLYFDSLLSLDSYVGLGPLSPVQIFLTIGIDQTEYTIQQCDHILYEGKYRFTVTVSPSLNINVSSKSTVVVKPISFGENGGSTTMPLYGIVTTNTNGYLSLADINGIIPTNDITSPLVIVIFKQFGFSGGNYNTIVSSIPGVSPGSISYRRVYASGSGVSAVPALSLLQGEKILPPQNISNLFLDQSDITGSTNLTAEINAFQNPTEPFKIPLSMYYPVWNPVVFQQECIRCKPNLIAYPNLGSNGNLSSVTIQYSGRDFDNYQYFIDSNAFHFSSFSELDTSKINSNGKFYLTEPNENVRIGDYVMNPSFNFPVDVRINRQPVGTDSYIQKLTIMRRIKYTDNCVGYPGAPGSQCTTDYGIEESIHERPKVKNVIIQDSGTLNLIHNNDNTYSIDFNTSSNPDGYCFGKLYQPVNNSDAFENEIGFYLVPKVLVIGISPDKKIITTNIQIPGEINSSSLLQFGKYIQFCRLDKSLEIRLIENLGVDNIEESNEGQGNGYEIEVSRISGGRITNLNVVKEGSNFLQENLPIVTVANYDYYVT